MTPTFFHHQSPTRIFMFKNMIAVAALAIVSTAASAAGVKPFYAGIDFTNSKIDNFGKREVGYGLNAGYNITSNFGVEVSYRRIADFDVIVAGAPVGLDFKQAAVSAIGSIPVGKDFSVFGRLGYNKITAKATVGGYKGTGSDSGALYGAGVGYAFSDAASARLEVQRPGSDVRTIVASVLFAF
jgi:OOP family OmpA-OmpF porin